LGIGIRLPWLSSHSFLSYLLPTLFSISHIRNLNELPIPSARLGESIVDDFVISVRPFVASMLRTGLPNAHDYLLFHTIATRV
jgi:hypothetical protein